MTPFKYGSEVRRFGSRNPFIYYSGKPFNLSHEENIDWSDVCTDGVGNVSAMPLLKRKPCFGRPERWLRGMLETSSYRQSADTIGYSRTRCDQCQLKSPDTFAACASLATERIDTAPAIKRAVDEWVDTAEHRKDDRDPDPYKDAFGGRWERVLRVIRQHNGWTNTNDDVAAGAERAKQDEAKDRKNGSRREARREHRERFKDAMVNAPSFRLTPDQRQAVLAGRAAGLSLGTLAAQYGVSRAAIQRIEKRG